MKSDNRDLSIDFAKGCAILAMVVGHVCQDRIPDVFVNLFHMPFFLMASGYFFNCKKAQDLLSLRSFAVSKVWRLYVPYVFWTFTFVILNNLLLKAHFLCLREEVGVEYKHFAYTSYLTLADVPSRLVKVLLMHDWTQYTDSCWFLVYLLYVCVLYASVTYVLKRMSLKVMFWQTLFALACCEFGRFASWHEFYGGIKVGVGGRLFVCYALFHLGVMLRNVDMEELLRRNLIAMFALLLSLGALIGLCVAGCRIGIFMNKYDNGFVLILAAISGWVMLHSAARMVKSYAEPVLRFGAFVGRCTMYILIFHRLAIAVVNAVMVLASGLPLVKIAARPTAFSGVGWDCGFVMAGVLLPLLLHYPYSCLHNIRRSHR